jgi:hypothetical protein
VGRWLAAGILFSLGAQVTVQTPVTPEGVTRRGGTSSYGEPVFVELSSIAFSHETHQRQHVRTRGRLDVLEPNLYFVLADGNARVLVLAGQEIALSDLTRFIGRDAEVRGIVRFIRKKEYLNGVDLDLIEDPTLPPLPAPRGDWPRVSLTLLGLSDLEAGASGKGRPSGRSSVAELLANPPPPTGKVPTVVILGLFRGRNLFGDLPAASQRKPEDWVLKDGEQALWVTGKEPKGKGWSLDPGYRGDAVRWVEVEGKPEVVGGVLYLQASRLRLAKRPEEPAVEDEP